MKYSQRMRFAPMIVAASLLSAGVARAEPPGFVTVTVPTDTIQIVNGVNDGDGSAGPPPGGEGVANAIDGTTNKYLNFLDNGSGFTVQLVANGPRIVNGLQIFTANDAEARDPASFLLEGSNAGFGGTFVTVASGALTLPAGRNGTGVAINDSQSNQFVTFGNTTAFSFYRLTFPTLKNAGGTDSMQIAEARLLSGPVAVVPEPSAMALFGLAGVIGVGIVRRRSG